MAGARRALTPLSLVLAGVLVCGCARGVREADSRTLHLAWSSDPVTLDPARVVDVVGGAACAMLYEGLVTCDREGNIVPALATSWIVSPDGRTYHFRLDLEARDSDGSGIEAHDVVASFRRVLDPETASPRAWVFANVAGVGEEDPSGEEYPSGLRTLTSSVVEITLKKPSAAFLGLLTMPAAAVARQPRFGEMGSVATGPWVLVERARDSHLSFRRNPHWHGRQAGFDSVFVRIIPEDFTRVAEFEVGHLDILEIPAAEALRFRRDERLRERVQRQTALVTEYVGLNNEDPVLADPNVRRALNHAVNVDLILERVLEGRGVRSVGAIPPGLPGGGQGRAFPYDPQRARSLLEAARLPDGWTLKLWQRPSPLASQVLEAVQADLKAVGIEAEILRRDWSALKAAIDRGEAQSFFINWYADYPDPENFLMPLFHSRNIGGGGNRARFRDAAVDSSLAELDRASEPSRRAQLASEIDARIHAQAPWIYLWHPVLEYAVSERIARYRPHPVPSCERWLDLVPADSPRGS